MHRHGDKWPGQSTNRARPGKQTVYHLGMQTKLVQWDNYIKVLAWL